MTSSLNALLHSGNSRPQFIRFVAVGGLVTLISYLCYLLFLLLELSPGWSYSFSYACGLGISYLLHLRITFRGRGSKTKFVAFAIVNVLCYLLGGAMILGLVHLGVAPWLAGLLMMLLMVPLRFVFNRYLFLSWMN